MPVIAYRCLSFYKAVVQREEVASCLPGSLACLRPGTAHSLMQHGDSPPPATVEPGPGIAAHPLSAFPNGAMVCRVRAVGGD